MKTMLISAVAIVVPMIGAPLVMASQGYWTLDHSFPGKGLKKYHLFLDGTYPSYIDRSTKLVNQNLSVCLEFVNYTTPFVCHQIKENEIPRTNDSIVDMGYFVVSDKLNETTARACIHTGYHNWDWCNSQTLDDYYYAGS